MSGRANEGIVSADVKLTVEGNYFVRRPMGIEGLTQYDTLQHSVTLTIRNNIFYGTTIAISLDEAGLVGKIPADIAFDTFESVNTSLRLINVGELTTFAPQHRPLGVRRRLQRALHGRRSSITSRPADDRRRISTSSGKMINADPQFVDWPNLNLRMKRSRSCATRSRATCPPTITMGAHAAPRQTSARFRTDRPGPCCDRFACVGCSSF